MFIGVVECFSVGVGMRICVTAIVIGVIVVGIASIACIDALADPTRLPL